jgi:hypothetical protein
MVTRLAMVVLVLLAAGSACAESLGPDAARRFVAGKLFVFNCFDGSRGAVLVLLRYNAAALSGASRSNPLVDSH